MQVGNYKPIIYEASDCFLILLNSLKEFKDKQIVPILGEHVEILIDELACSPSREFLLKKKIQINKLINASNDNPIYFKWGIDLQKIIDNWLLLNK